MEEKNTVFGYLLFPEYQRSAYLIKQMDDAEVQGGLVDQLEAQGYRVTIVDAIRIIVNNHFYRILLDYPDGQSRVLYGNLPFHAEALEIETPEDSVSNDL